jgi:hypothetical protein
MEGTLKTPVLFPAVKPFRNHWYPGFAPPFTGIAVKVTGVFSQIIPGGKPIVTEAGGGAGIIFMVMRLETAGLGDAQATLEVIISETLSPFNKPAVEYTAVLVPALTPFTCH